ncbi:hypothetical protein C7271_06940 [filamentous cyanobacterium CCP5]|nr:hypothetical protein C7271_06940 [filamentous cyanobacterium CCP5]
MSDSAPRSEKDFFISYNGADKAWAQWIAWILEEEAGYQVVIQAWDFRPGGNFVLDMQRAARCQRTIAVLSQNYLDAEYTQPEWAAAYKQDPQSVERKLIPIRVGKCKPDGLLAAIVYVDLVGTTRGEAKQRILEALQERAKPETEPAFPGEAEESLEMLETREKPESQPAFPGEADATGVAAAETSTDIENPFLPLGGGIEESHRFFNCEKTLDRVFELLNARSNVALIGEPNLGKSSLLREIRRQAPDRLDIPRMPIYLNLTNAFTEEDFFEDVCTAIGLEKLVGNAFVRKLHRERTEHRYLLLLDEIERFCQEGFTRRIREQLWGIADTKDAPLKIVFASRLSLDQLFQDSYQDREVSPLENICVEENLVPWSQEISRKFIAARLADGPIQFSDDEVEAIVGGSDGNPQKLMQECHQLFNRHRETLS